MSQQQIAGIGEDLQYFWQILILGTMDKNLNLPVSAAFTSVWLTSNTCYPDYAILGTLSKWGQRHQSQEARKIFLHNPRLLLSTSLLWLPCVFLFSLQRLLLNETMDVSSWNVGNVSKTAWKWSSLIWEQDGTNVSFISNSHMRFLSSVISLIVLATLSLPLSYDCTSLLVLSPSWTFHVHGNLWTRSGWLFITALNMSW